MARLSPAFLTPLGDEPPSYRKDDRLTAGRARPDQEAAQPPY
jgi:hypothetical protein